MRRPAFTKAVLCLVQLLSVLILAGTNSPAHGQGKKGHGASVPQKWALLIGVDQYDDPRIPRLYFAAADARKLKQTLIRQVGIPADHIQLLVSDAQRDEDGAQLPGRAAIIAQIAQLAKRIQPGDTVFVFFSGHGIVLEKQAYLLPYDAQYPDDETLTYTALEVSKLKERLSKVPAGLLVLCFDMCRNVPRAGDRNGTQEANLLTPEMMRSLDFAAVTTGADGGNNGPRAVMTLYSCSAGERSYEWVDKGQGYFTYFLTEGLAGKAAEKNGSVTVSSLMEYVSRQVSSVVKEREKKVQTPFLEADGAIGAQRIALMEKGKETATASVAVAEDNKGYLEVKATPGNAQILVEGAALPASGRFAVEFTSGEEEKAVEVGVDAPGYRPKVQKVIIQRGALLALTVKLTRSETPEASPESSPAVSPPPSPGNGGGVLTAAQVLALPAPRTLAEYKAQMALIPGGTFLMGSNDGESDEKPVHSVTLSGFRMGRTPVTVAMWKEYCKATGKEMPPAPDWGWLDDHPMVKVSWNDAKAYCDWAGLQLPSEAQWEYAAKGGREVKYPWGNDWDGDTLIWDKTSGGKTAPVYRSERVFVNGYGLVDMAGNVRQWCADWYGSYSANAATNPVGASGGTWRVLRGGSWDNYTSDDFRASYRYYGDPSAGYNSLGFRAVATPPIVVSTNTTSLSLPPPKPADKPVNAVVGAATSLVPGFSSEDWHKVQFEGGRGELTKEGDTVRLTVTNPGVDWHVQCSKIGLDLQEGQEYIIQFSARADRIRRARVVTLAFHPERNSGLNEALALTTEWQEFRLRFTARSTAMVSLNRQSALNKLEFWLGEERGDVWLREVSLRPVNGTNTASLEKVTDSNAANATEVQPTRVLIQKEEVHLGDNPGNQGVVFEKIFTIPTGVRKATLQFSIRGPNYQHTPVFMINDVSPQSLQDFFPEYTTSGNFWQTNFDKSRDYNGTISVSVDITRWIKPGQNSFRMQNGIAADDYFFRDVVVLLER